MGYSSAPTQYVVTARLVIEAWTPELAAETAVEYTQPKHLRRVLLPTGGIVAVEISDVKEVGPAVALDAEILPMPDSPEWCDRWYYLDDAVVRHDR